MFNNEIGWGERLIALVVLVVALGFDCYAVNILFPAAVTSVAAPTPDPYSQPIGGPAYPVGADKVIEYWAVNCDQYVSHNTILTVEDKLQGLNADNIAQVVFMCMPEDQVTDPVPYATQFMRWFRLGLAEGERKDNGIVYLFLVGDQTLDVHYGVGDGLPSLTAIHLAEFNRQTEADFKSSGLDIAMVNQANRLDEYARSKYQPYVAPESESNPPADSGNSDLNLILGCIGIILFALGISEPFLAIGALMGSYDCFKGMAWPLWILSNLGNGSSGGYSGRSSSSGSYGGSFSGGGSSGGGHSGGGGGGHSGRGG